MKSKTTFKHEALLDPKTTQEILKSIGKSLVKGELEFTDSDGGVMALDPSKLLYVKVSASDEEGRQQVELKIRWDKLPKQINSEPPIIK